MPDSPEQSNDRITYGLEWESHVTQLTIELWIYKNALKAKDLSTTPDLIGADWEHLTNAFKIWAPETLYNGRAGHIMNPWTQRRIQLWCAHRFQTWWGPAAAGKTKDAAIISLLDYFSAPQDTCTVVCSTTRPMLEKRIWAEIMNFFIPYENHLPAELKKAKHSIVALPEIDPKAGIHGVAIMQGTVEEALGNLIGLHMKNVRVIIDEMQSTREAAVESCVNLSKGCLDFKFLGMGNPANRFDPLVRHGTHVDGFAHCNPSLPGWPTKRGYCAYFDGYKSPGVQDPKKYWFMLRQDQIDETEKWEGSKNTVNYWSQCRGFPPPEGVVPTLIPSTMLDVHNTRNGVEWDTSPVFQVAGMDPAYASGGNRCVVFRVQVGIDTHGNLKLLLMKPDIIALDVTVKDLTMSQAIARQVKKLLEDNNIPLNYFAADCTATQGAIIDMIEMEMKRTGVLRVNFGESPTDHKMSVDSEETGKELCANRVTELWMNIYNFIRYDHIRGLNDDVAIELSCRSVIPGLKKRKLESKKDLIARMGFSPDLADSLACAVAVLIERCGILPGQKQLDTVEPEDSNAATEQEPPRYAENIEGDTRYHDSLAGTV